MLLALAGFSGECLVQIQSFASRAERQVGRVDVGILSGPDLCEFDALISQKVDGGGVKRGPLRSRIELVWTGERSP